MTKKKEIVIPVKRAQVKNDLECYGKAFQMRYYAEYDEKVDWENCPYSKADINMMLFNLVNGAFR